MPLLHRIGSLGFAVYISINMTLRHQKQAVKQCYKYVLYCSALEIILLQLMPVGKCLYCSMLCLQNYILSAESFVSPICFPLERNTDTHTIGKTHTYRHPETHSLAYVHTEQDFKMVIILNFEIRGNEGETFLGKLLF